MAEIGLLINSLGYCQIAAIARANGMTLATHNVAKFGSVSSRHPKGETIRWLQHGLESGYYQRQYGSRRSLAEVVRSAKCGSCRRIHDVMYRVPLVFSPQPEGGYTVTSPALPELLTEGDTLEEANANVRDAFEAVVELYAEQGRPLPASISLPGSSEIVWSEALVGSP